MAGWALCISILAILLSGISLWHSFRLAKRAQDFDYAQLRAENFQLSTELQTLLARNSLEAQLLKYKTDDPSELRHLSEVAADQLSLAGKERELCQVGKAIPVPSQIKASDLTDLQAAICKKRIALTKYQETKSLLERTKALHKEYGGGDE